MGGSGVSRNFVISSKTMEKYPLTEIAASNSLTIERQEGGANQIPKEASMKNMNPRKIRLGLFSILLSSFAPIKEM
jgi:hypothetical protein